MVGTGTQPSAISCTRALPREATRIVTWTGPLISGLGGSVVTAPVHTPARLFKASNEICASGFAGLAPCVAEAFCADPAEAFWENDPPPAVKSAIKSAP